MKSRDSWVWSWPSIFEVRNEPPDARTLTNQNHQLLQSTYNFYKQDKARTHIPYFTTDYPAGEASKCYTGMFGKEYPPDPDCLNSSIAFRCLDLLPVASRDERWTVMENIVDASEKRHFSCLRAYGLGTQGIKRLCVILIVVN